MSTARMSGAWSAANATSPSKISLHSRKHSDFLRRSCSRRLKRSSTSDETGCLRMCQQHERSRAPRSQTRGSAELSHTPLNMPRFVCATDIDSVKLPLNSALGRPILTNKARFQSVMIQTRCPLLARILAQMRESVIKHLRGCHQTQRTKTPWNDDDFAIRCCVTEFRKGRVDIWLRSRPLAEVAIRAVRGC
jgi:hypothetical protein